MQMSNRIYERAVSLMLAFLMVIVIPVSLRADGGNAESWTAVGSTGTVDESNLGQVGFYQGVAFNGGSGTATLRYNVTATDDLFGSGPTSFTMRYLDTGSCTKVEACLFRYSFTGTNDLLMTINSDSFTQATAFQTKSISASLPAFDFKNNAYYIEVYLTDNCGSGNARIGLLRLERP